MELSYRYACSQSNDPPSFAVIERCLVAILAHCVDQLGQRARCHLQCARQRPALFSRLRHTGKNSRTQRFSPREPSLQCVCSSTRTAVGAGCSLIMPVSCKYRSSLHLSLRGPLPVDLPLVSANLGETSGLPQHLSHSQPRDKLCQRHGENPGCNAVGRLGRGASGKVPHYLSIGLTA